MKKKTLTDDQYHGSYPAYISGFILSLILTLCAFILTNWHVGNHHSLPSDKFMLIALAILALTQLFVQLMFFLHLDRESKPWWNNTAFAFAIITVITIVGGSIWIMSNLDYHHGPRDVTHTGHELKNPSQINDYIINDEGIKP